MITLIGKDLAEEGLVFTFHGPAEICESCRFKTTCVESLEEGRKYKIISVKDTEQRCQLHDGGIVKVVEVEKANVNALIDSKKAFEGSTIFYNPPDCDIDCIFRELCFCEGLFPEDKCIIIKNLGKHDGGCGKMYSLSKVLLRYG